MPVEGEPVVPEGYKPLRDQMASGEVDGQDYRITRSGGTVLVEFDDFDEHVEYSFEDILLDAWDVVREDEEE